MFLVFTSLLEVLSLKENLYEETEEIIEKIVETRRQMRGKVNEIETPFLQQDLYTLVSSYIVYTSNISFRLLL